MNRIKMKRLALAAFVAVALSGTSGGVAVADAPTTPSIDVLLKRLGYNEDDKAALLSGKIITTDLKKTRDDQLIAAVAMQLNAPIATLAENARKGLNIERDQDVMAFGKLTDKGGIEEFGKARYTEKDGDEIKRLIDVKADGTFNLSEEEMKALSKALSGVKAGDSSAADKTSEAYQAVLAGRHQTYLEKGLDGIANYEAGAKLEPAEQLRAVYDQAKPFLDEFFPGLGKALGEFPNGQSPDISSDFYWMKRDVEGRPAFILAHQMVRSGEDYVLLSQRQYFVGHTYQSLQVVAVALPTEKGSAVFYANSAYTDKITGFFSGVAQSVGQSRTKEDLTKYFEGVSKVSPVQTAVRNCTRDEGGPFGFGDQELIPSYRKLLWSKAMVVSVAEKSGR